MFGKLKTTNKSTKQTKQTNQTSVKEQKQNNFPSRTHKIYKNKYDSKLKPSQNRHYLKGSQFRILNQILYTQDSQKAVQYFEQNPQYCNVYHEGFREQTISWEINPLDIIIKMLLDKSKQINNKKVIDLGCGQGRLQQSIQHTGCKIKSYDIMQLKPFIVKADIANLPIKNQCKDIAVFCLSLMGTNYIEFIFEATRVLKMGGQLIIAEVQSRCKDWKLFKDLIGSVGYTLKSQKVQKYFRLIVFQKSQNSKYSSDSLYKKGQTLTEYSQTILNPCIYKRR